MWKTIAEKELRDHLQSTRFLVAASVSTILIVMSVWLGITHYKVRVAQYEQGVQMMLDLASQQTNWNIVTAAAWRHPDPMEIFSNGVNSDIGRYSDIGSFRNVRLVRSEYSDDPMLAAFQFLDPTFVVLIVLSLIAILFTYNAVNGEKESGTLKLVFANRVSKAEYILGKLIGSWLAILAPVLISFLLGALLLIVLGIGFSASHWGRYRVLCPDNRSLCDVLHALGGLRVGPDSPFERFIPCPACDMDLCGAHCAESSDDARWTGYAGCDNRRN